MTAVTIPGLLGTLERYEKVGSMFVDARNIDVWMPPGYEPLGNQRYPVLYMHDGQNLFDPSLSSSSGFDWGIDESLVKLAHEQRARPVIVVGIWSNKASRWLEYMPQKPVDQVEGGPLRSWFIKNNGGVPFSNNYLKFIVQELKPFIDIHYNTLPNQPNTFVMGSSMGALISLYAISEYPMIFGGAGCLSTHWTAGGDYLVDSMGKALPDPRTHKLYFDYGTQGLDASYEPRQQRMDTFVRAAGYQPGVNWITQKFEGTDHSERDWRQRVHIPLSLLLSPPRST